MVGRKRCAVHTPASASTSASAARKRKKAVAPKRTVPKRAVPKKKSRAQLERENAALKKKVASLRKKSRPKLRPKKPSAWDWKRQLRRVTDAGLLDQYVGMFSKALGLSLREVYTLALSPDA